MPEPRVGAKDYISDTIHMGASSGIQDKTTVKQNGSENRRCTLT